MDPNKWFVIIYYIYYFDRKSPASFFINLFLWILNKIHDYFMI